MGKTKIVDHDCLDYLIWGKVEIYEDDKYQYEDYPCSMCGKIITWKYKLVGIFDAKGKLIKKP